MTAALAHSTTSWASIVPDGMEHETQAAVAKSKATRSGQASNYQERQSEDDVVVMSPRERRQQWLAAMRKSAKARVLVAADLNKQVHELTIPVPPDGLCLSYVLLAAHDTNAWQEGRDAVGWTTKAREEEDRIAAKDILANVIRLAEQAGNIATATRLRKAGSEGYPGMDELGYFATIAKGRIELFSLMEPEASRPIASYGSGRLKI